MLPRLVAFDLDGTLIGRDLAISPRVRESVARMESLGILGAIVTGRMYRATLPFARALGFETPIVCYQGAAIVDPVTDNIIRDTPLSNTTVRELIEIAERDRMHLQLYRNDNYYCEQRNAFSALYAQFARIEPIIVDSLREAFIESDATKAVFVATPSDAERCYVEVSEALGARAYVTRSCPEFVEILNPTVDKGEALRFLATRLGIRMRDVLAIGDSWNDAPLLGAAGYGVAMGSAPPELKAVADAVVADVDHDGVAEALERYLVAAAP